MFLLESPPCIYSGKNVPLSTNFPRTKYGYKSKGCAWMLYSFLASMDLVRVKNV
jgi:hypothetical protein